MSVEDLFKKGQLRHEDVLYVDWVILVGYLSNICKVLSGITFRDVDSVAMVLHSKTVGTRVVPLCDGRYSRYDLLKTVLDVGESLRKFGYVTYLGVTDGENVALVSADLFDYLDFSYIRRMRISMEPKIAVWDKGKAVAFRLLGFGDVYLIFSPPSSPPQVLPSMFY